MAINALFGILTLHTNKLMINIFPNSRGRLIIFMTDYLIVDYIESLFLSACYILYKKPLRFIIK